MWKDSLMVFARVSGWIAFPVILALYVGKWLDVKYGTAPWLFLVCTGLAFIVSTFGLVREVRKYMDSISKVYDDRNNTSDTK